MLLHGHCHQKAFGAMGSVGETLALIEGLEVETVELSCCGMAGAFGYGAETHAVSLAMGELSLLPAVRRAAPDAIIAADGFSCRHQIHDGTGRAPRHVARILRQAMAGGAAIPAFQSYLRPGGLRPMAAPAPGGRCCGRTVGCSGTRQNRQHGHSVGWVAPWEGKPWLRRRQSSETRGLLKSPLDFGGGLFLIGLAIVGYVGGFSLPFGQLSGIGSGLLPKTVAVLVGSLRR